MWKLPSAYPLDTVFGLERLNRSLDVRMSPLELSNRLKCSFEILYLTETPDTEFCLFTLFI